MSRRAFSIIELLVVLGVIGVVLALAIPALNATRAYAAEASCRSILRQLLQVQQTYLDNRRFTAVWSDTQPPAWRLRLFDPRRARHHALRVPIEP